MPPPASSRCAASPSHSPILSLRNVGHKLLRVAVDHREREALDVGFWWFFFFATSWRFCVRLPRRVVLALSIFALIFAAVIRVPAQSPPLTMEWTAGDEAGKVAQVPN